MNQKTAVVESVAVYLTWNALEAGQFKPVKFGVETAAGKPVRVKVNVPFTNEYIASTPEDLIAQMYGEKEVGPVVLTLKGMAYVLNEVQKATDNTGLDPEDEGEWSEVENDLD